MNKPFLLKPSGKDYLWGGNRLNEEFGKNIDMSPLAETWECSTHPDGPSYARGGEFDGMTLAEILKAHPEFSGEHPEKKDELPILIKFIDAKSDLSVQVHPTDEYAKEFENGQLGKTEMWYVLDAAKEATLVYGLKEKSDKETVRRAICDGKLEDYLEKVQIKKGDVFFIEAGTVHAIGAGALIAEIQQNSNLTYRMYDYDRKDKNGNKRELHIDKALAVAELCPAAKRDTRKSRTVFCEGMSKEPLASCNYFEVSKMTVNTEKDEAAVYAADEKSFRVLLCIDGNGTASFDGEILNIKKGDCMFVPANSVNIKLQGNMTFLDVRA